ncbi:LamG domain-containing protein [Catenovulum agarivorans]|uniref:LamG domain-containing protein n=1 Tax=Catenovulum agarivorans TaxID=1172192 RepID=UPI0002E2AA1B|nr:LamG domain-containing protein [Catenovulum agarivorans]
MSTSDKFPEVRDIADAVCSDCATNEQLVQLETLLTGNYEAQEFYYDYLSMHMQLKSPADNNMEFIYRRISEEFVVRPKDTPPPNHGNNTFDHEQEDPDYFRIKKRVIFFGLLVIISIIVSIWWYATRSATSHIAQVIDGVVIPMGRHADMQGDYLFTGDYRIEQDATLEMTDGRLLHLTKDSIIKLFNHDEIRLKLGKITIEPGENKKLILHAKKGILHPNGNGLIFDLTHSAPRLTTGENTGITPLRWRPKHYWGFNDKGDRVFDSAGNAHGIPATGAKRIKGLVGQGAFMFDNSENARIELGSGGGTAPGTGTFAVNDGVTIEALIKPNYSGKFGEIDEIFRKDHGDKDLRITLSFQNDRGKSFLRPNGEYQQSLSFGLFILGQGYHELKLPLDGKEGRPSLTDLTDGNFHHVVATYNVQTGLKAMYINGKRLASYQYPVGSKILSGGPGLAAIGNNPAKERWHKEAFAGVIDEVAFYDYALPEFMVNQHLEYYQQGKNLIGLPPSDQALPPRPRLTLPKNTTFELDFVTGLPSHIIHNPNSK